MKNRGILWIAALLPGLLFLTGCGGEIQKIYQQAGQALEAGDYESALQGYMTAAGSQVRLPQSYRGAGIANLHLGNYEEAVQNFTDALNCERVGKGMRQDILSYRATAEYQSGDYEAAMADCQKLAEDYTKNLDVYFLTGKVALAMDAYDEAASNFAQAYAEDATYDTAIRIYEAYLERDMEADGTRYLEAALATEPKTAEDYCDRGHIYYYMEDYVNARTELIRAANEDSTEAILLLGMVYLAQNDISNARSMYQDYIAAAGTSAKGYNGLALCDMAEGNYDRALEDISAGLPYSSEEEMQDLLHNEIVAYEKKLDFASAKTKAEEYLHMYPEDEEMARELVFLNSRVRGQQ